MSTGLECTFVHYESGWYYILEQGSAPKLSWDWREFADMYGPFSSFEEAAEHLHKNHANPGGYSHPSEGAPPTEPDDVERELLKTAKANRDWCDSTYLGPGLRVIGW